MGIDLSDLNPIKGFVEGVANIVDQFVQSPDEKAAVKTRLLELADQAEERAQKAMQGARDAYMEEFKSASHTTKFDSFVDGMNRLVRPVVTYGLVLAVFGIFEVPENINDNIWTPLTVALAFWFGGRLLKRDGGADMIKSLKKGDKK